MRGSYYILMMIILNTFQLHNLLPQFSLLNEIITIDLISFGAFLSANRIGGDRAERSPQSNTQYQQQSSNREKDYMRVRLEVPEVSVPLPSDSFSSWNVRPESKVSFQEELLCDKRTYPRVGEELKTVRRVVVLLTLRRPGNSSDARSVGVELEIVQ